MKRNLTEWKTSPHFQHSQCAMTNKTTSKRSHKCVEKIENLLCALNIEKNKNEKDNAPLFRWGLILWYLPQPYRWGKRNWGVEVLGEYKRIKHSLMEYFTPTPLQTIFPVRYSKESIDACYTRLLAQIIQGRSSYRIKRKALQENCALKQLLDEARAKQMTYTRITEIVKKKMVTEDSSGQRWGRNRSDQVSQ